MGAQSTDAQSVTMLHLETFALYIAFNLLINQIAQCVEEKLTCVSKNSHNHVHATGELVHFVGVIALGACNWRLRRLNPV